MSVQFHFTTNLSEIPKQINNIIETEKYIYEKKNFYWNASSDIIGKSTVFVILGETTRGDHMYINGYGRRTNPLLIKEDIISFDNAISNASHTIAATSYIMTRKPTTDEWIYKIYPEKSFISAFKEAGYKTFYISYLGNVHMGDNAINHIVNEADVYIKRPSGEVGCERDSVGLPILKEVLLDKTEKN